MKAVQVQGSPASHTITTTSTVPIPRPGPSQLLIRVHAAGITADEVTWPELYATPSRVPGHDVSGTVHALGADYQGPLAVGDRVFAMLHADRGEGQAEYVVATADEVAKMPASLSWAQAAVLPVPALTAWQALRVHAHVDKGAKVLVTGASGAVGRMAVQMASRVLDAEVIGLASADNAALVRRLGARDVLDYRVADWPGQCETGKVDVVFDTVGGDVLHKSWDLVAGTGVIVTVGDPPPKWAFGRCEADEAKTHPGVRYLHFILSPDRDSLVRVADMLDQGTIEALPVETFSWEEAVEAWRFAGQRGRKAKSVITF